MHGRQEPHSSLWSIAIVAGLALGAASVSAADVAGGVGRDLGSTLDPLLASVVNACNDGAAPVATEFDPDLGMRVTLAAVCVSQAASPAGDAPSLSGHEACDQPSFTHHGHSWSVPTVVVDPGLAFSVRFEYDDSEEPPGLRNPWSAFDHAVHDWEQATAEDIYDTIGTNGAAAGPDQRDDVNVLAWQDLGQNKVLAYARTYSTPLINGPELAVESDHVYNTAYPWEDAPGSSPSRFDLESVATHEMGHTFGLDHVSETPENSCLVMYPSIPPGQTKENLGLGDRLGIQELYGSR